MPAIHCDIQLPDNCANLRLDQALAKLYPEYSRSRIQQWIKNGAVTVDHKILRAKDLVKAGQHVEIKADLPSEASWQAQAIPLSIVYEDESIIVINKPPGLVVHPAAGNRDNTLLNALLHHAPELAKIPRAGLIHRLDKDTSGLLVIAKTLAAHQYLIKEMQQRNIKREYQALVQGEIISGASIEAPIGRHPSHRTRMAVVEAGKWAMTHYRVLERFTGYTLLKVTLETGRTHQIRVHLAHKQHPVVGDSVYGARLKFPRGINEELREKLRNFKRQALHAWRLELIHPKTSELMGWEAPLPEDMQQLLHELRKK